MIIQQKKKKLPFFNTTVKKTVPKEAQLAHAPRIKANRAIESRVPQRLSVDEKVARGAVILKPQTDEAEFAVKRAS